MNDGKLPTISLQVEKQKDWDRAEEKMKIPKRFKLMGQTIEIVYDASLNDVDDNVGQTRYRRNQIVLQSHVEGVFRLPSSIEKTFLHELFHWLFHMAGEEELRNNERLIAVLAGLLHQAMTTMEYEEE